MKDTVWIALIVSLVSTIAAIAAWRESKHTTGKANIIIAKAEEIHVLTNSNLTAVKADLALANERIIVLESLVSRLTDKLS